MGIKITKMPNLKKVVANKLQSMRPVLERQILFIRTEIQTRTRKGLNADGMPWPGKRANYSKGYAAYREERGRTTSPVDLWFTGDMLKSIQTTIRQEASKLIGVLYITANQTEKVRQNEAQGRKFFGLSAEQVTKLVNAFKTR